MSNINMLITKFLFRRLAESEHYYYFKKILDYKTGYYLAARTYQIESPYYSCLRSHGKGF